MFVISFIQIRKSKTKFQPSVSQTTTGQPYDCCHVLAFAEHLWFSTGSAEDLQGSSVHTDSNGLSSAMMIQVFDNDKKSSERSGRKGFSSFAAMTKADSSYQLALDAWTKWMASNLCVDWSCQAFCTFYYLLVPVWLTLKTVLLLVGAAAGIEKHPATIHNPSLLIGLDITKWHLLTISNPEVFDPIWKGFRIMPA